MEERLDKEKASLRELMLAKRKAISLKGKRSYDHDICEKLKAITVEKEAKVVHSYLPIKAEIDVTPYLQWLLEKQIKVVCPKVLPKRQLENRELLHFDSFDIGPFNTIHPAGNIVYKGIIDLVVMPGLAFDIGLNRLGYGGGYYDRFLTKHPEAYTVAILYPFQMVDYVPVDTHDIQMDELLLSNETLPYPTGVMASDD